MEKNDEGPGSASPLPATARIAARLAHNLRNLLMIMGRRIDSIRGELPARSAIEEDLAELDRNLDRAFHLTHQLLEIGHPARRERVVVDLNQLVVEAERMIDRVLENVITPQFQLAATQPHVRADPYELEWILLNLVMNSREAMPTGGRLSLETANHAREVPGGSQSVIRLTVADSGQGPASKTEDRTPSRLNDAGDLAAIRLGNVAILVDNLGGWLDVDFQEGRGTTVHVDLPVAFSSGDREAP
jgi:two-component system, cell cycle sensor histidine kinase and response regulator CckA